MENDKILLNEAEVAEMTGLSKRTLQAWRYRGGGPPFIKLGRAVRYRKSDIVEWINEQAVRSTAEHTSKQDGESSS